MGSLKHQALNAIASLPDNASLAEILDRLYDIRRSSAALPGAGSPPPATPADRSLADLRLDDAEQRWLSQHWAQQGPQGPLEDDSDGWP